MGRYISDKDVMVRLKGKVSFTEDGEKDKDKMDLKLLRRLIAEAEADVEFEMSPRYNTPFLKTDDQPFAKIANMMTINIIRTLCELMSVIRVLETDFGRGTVVNGDEYAEKLRDRYQKMVDRVMAKKDGSDAWKYPPLPELKSNWFNLEADDGYAGQILVTSQEDGDYPKAQITDPSENYFNGVVDILDADE